MVTAAIVAVVTVEVRETLTGQRRQRRADHRRTLVQRLSSSHDRGRDLSHRVPRPCVRQGAMLAQGAEQGFGGEAFALGRALHGLWRLRILHERPAIVTVVAVVVAVVVVHCSRSNFTDIRTLLTVSSPPSPRFRARCRPQILEPAGAQLFIHLTHKRDTRSNPHSNTRTRRGACTSAERTIPAHAQPETREYLTARSTGGSGCWTPGATRELPPPSLLSSSLLRRALL